MVNLPIKQPPVNYSSQGSISAKAFLLNPALGVWLTAASGGPTSGTSGDGAGWAGPGSMYIDVGTGNVYFNTNTTASPTWTIVGTTAASPSFTNITLTGNLIKATADSITAHAGGGKASATALTKDINRISVCATNADSVLLPAATAGREVAVINDGAANAQVFGAGTDTIDGVATGTGVVLTAAKRDVFYCVTTGAWQSLQGVKSV